MMLFQNLIRTFVLTALILSNTSCEKKIVLDRKVAKGDSGDYDGSCRKIAAAMTAEEKREFDEMLQEIKYSNMEAHAGLTTVELNGVIREKIEGHTVREILLMGYAVRLKRAETQQSALLNYQKIYQGLRTRPGNDEAVKDLAELKQQQVDGLKSLDLLIQATRGRMRELGTRLQI